MTIEKSPTAVITPDGNALIISAPNPLRDKIGVTGGGPIDTAAIARAEAAIKELSVEFDDWMKEEVQSLMAAYEDVRTHGLTQTHGNRLYLVSHDMRGQAQTLGYPLIGRYCASICKMFDAVTDATIIPLHAIDSHIGAISVAINNMIKDQEDATANAVLSKLEKEVLEFYDYHKNLQEREAEENQDQNADKAQPKVNIHDLADAAGAVIVGKARKSA